jgi:hypothetical protein
LTTSLGDHEYVDIDKAHKHKQRSRRSQSLHTFTRKDLEQFTKKEVYSNTASQDIDLFYVGRDDVHNILKYVLSRVRVSLYVNMVGYDDELNDILMQKALDPNVTMLITLDKSQNGSQTENRQRPISRKTFQR